MPTTIYNPENFALLAGDEMSPDQNLPRLFGYYAETAAIEEILTSGGSPPTGGTLFFGLRTDGIGTPLTPDEKLLPSAAGQLTRGSMILIAGQHIDLEGQFGPINLLPYILYVGVVSEVGKNTSYTRLYLAV